MLRPALILALAMAASAAPGLAFPACYDLSKAQPKRLEGELSYRIFPGAPGFADVQKGDTPEPGYLLTLDAPICLTGEDEFADPDDHFDEVHLVATEATADAMQRLRNHRVAVELENPMPAMTGHHHRPLVAWVKAISPAEAPSDPTANYGTAGTVVQAFYSALEAGDGALAAGFVIPEKTRTGPFAAKSLSAFYGNLKEPLALLDVKPAGPDTFIARYRFVSKAGACDGRARVTTTRIGSRNYIKSIRAENGC